MRIEALLERQSAELTRRTAEELKRLMVLFVNSRVDLEKRLEAWLRRETPKYLRARGMEQGDRWTAGRSQAALAQVETGLQQISKGLAGVLQGGVARADALQIHHWMDAARAAEKQFGGGIAQRLDVRGALRAAESGSTLLERHGDLVRRWTAGSMGRVKAALAEEVLKGSPVSDVVDRLTREAGPVFGNRASALRIVRTEYVNRYNERTQEALSESVKDVPALKKRLITPMDARTAQDSLLIAALPGNIVRNVNEPFEDPARGTTFMYPPNRPNDRSRIVFWREEWGGDWKKDVANAQRMVKDRRAAELAERRARRGDA